MIADNLAEIQAKITDCCKRNNRDTGLVKLVGVSKIFPAPVLQEAYDAGLRIFGENKAQEFRDKVKVLPEDIEWHFIGHLQSNKIKYVVGKAELIHSVNSVDLAEGINDFAEKKGLMQNILIEVNTSGEDSKIGIESQADLYTLASEIQKMKSVNLKGLMTIGPNTDDEVSIRKAFQELRAYFDALNKDGYAMTELSMGMTQDFEIAIEEGATIIRIGTAIFGQRIYN